MEFRGSRISRVGVVGPDAVFDAAELTAGNLQGALHRQNKIPDSMSIIRRDEEGAHI